MHSVSESLQGSQRLLGPSEGAGRREEVWELSSVDKSCGTWETWKTLPRVVQAFYDRANKPRWEDIIRTGGGIRKCVFVISAGMRIGGKASSLPRRLFSLSHAGLLSKPREDKQHRPACQDPVCLLLSLPAGYSTAATSHLCFVFNLAFNSLTEPRSKSCFQGRHLKLWSITEQYLRNSNERGGRRLPGSPKNRPRLCGRSPHLPRSIWRGNVLS